MSDKIESIEFQFGPIPRLIEVELFGGPNDGFRMTLPAFANMVRRPSENDGWYVWRRREEVSIGTPVWFDYIGIHKE